MTSASISACNHELLQLASHIRSSVALCVEKEILETDSSDLGKILGNFEVAPPDTETAIQSPGKLLEHVQSQSHDIASNAVPEIQDEDSEPPPDELMPPTFLLRSAKPEKGDLQTEMFSQQHSEQQETENKKQFVGSHAQLCVSLAAAAYGKYTGVGYIGQCFWAHLCSSCTEDLVIFRRFDEKRTLELGFRGTVIDPSHIDQWLSNAGNVNCALRSVTGSRLDHCKGRVHAGFLDAYLDKICKAVRDQVNFSLEEDVHTVLISGHSRGAALATLCAADIASLYAEDDRLGDVQLVTFASPRVGDEDFVQHCISLEKLRSVRMVNRYDPVPWFPKRELPSKLSDMFTKRIEDEFRHLGPAVVLDRHIQNFGRACKDIKAAVLGVHDIDRYMENLRDQFRDYSAVYLSSLAPLAGSAVQYVWLAAQSKLFGDIAVSRQINDQTTELTAAIETLGGSVTDQMKLSAKQTMSAFEESNKKLGEKLIATIQSETHGQLLRDLQTEIDTAAYFRAGGGQWDESALVNKMKQGMSLLQKIEDTDVRDGLFFWILSGLDLVLSYLILEGKAVHVIQEKASLLVEGQFADLASRMLIAKIEKFSITKRELFHLLQSGAWPDRCTQAAAKSAACTQDAANSAACTQDAAKTAACTQDEANSAACTQDEANSAAGAGTKWLRKFSEVMLKYSSLQSVGANRHESFQIRLANVLKSCSPEANDKFCYTSHATKEQIDDKMLTVIALDGSTYVGEFRTQNGKNFPHGQGTVTLKKCQIELLTYRGRFTAGCIHGVGECVSPEGIVIHNGAWTQGYPVTTEQLQACLLRIVDKAPSLGLHAYDVSAAHSRDLEHSKAALEFSKKVSKHEKQYEKAVPKRTESLLCGFKDDRREAGTSPTTRVLRRKELKSDVLKLLRRVAGLCQYISQHPPIPGCSLPDLNSPLFQKMLELRKKVENTSVSIAVIGPVKAGKSTSINAMLGQKFSPSATLPMTVLPMVINHVPGCEVPMLHVTHHDIYNASASALRECLLNYNGAVNPEVLQQLLRDALRGDVEHRLYDQILANQFEVPEAVELTGEIGYNLLAHLNVLCRLEARFAIAVEKHIVMPMAECGRLLDSLESTTQKPGAKDKKHEDSLPSETETPGDEEAEDVESLSADHLIGCAETLVGWISAFPSPVELRVLNEQICREAASSSRWMAVLYRGGGSQALPKLKSWLQRATFHLPMFRRMLLPFKQNILQQLLAKSAAPWPVINFCMPMFDKVSADQVTRFSIVDTPGLDELSLLPELKDTLHTVLGRCQAVVCVCNATSVGTDAWQNVQDLVDMARKAATPVIILANRIPDDKTKAEKQDLLRCISSDIWGPPVEGKPHDGIFGVNAKSAYLSASIRKLSKNQSKLIEVFNSMYKKHVEERNAPIQQTSNATDDGLRCDEGDVGAGGLQPNASVSFTDEEQDLRDAMRIRNAGFFDEDSGEEEEKLDEWRKGAATNIEKLINHHARKGGLKEFQEHLTMKLMPKALAMQVKSSLMPLAQESVNNPLLVARNHTADVTEDFEHKLWGNLQKKTEWLEFLSQVRFLDSEAECWGLGNLYKFHDHGTHTSVAGTLARDIRKTVIEETENLAPRICRYQKYYWQDTEYYVLPAWQFKPKVIQQALSHLKKIFHFNSEEKSWIFEGDRCKSNGEKFAKAVGDYVTEQANHSFSQAKKTIQECLVANVEHVRRLMQSELTLLKCPRTGLADLLKTSTPSLTAMNASDVNKETTLGSVTEHDYGSTANWIKSFVFVHNRKMVKDKKFVITQEEVTHEIKRLFTLCFPIEHHDPESRCTTQRLLWTKIMVAEAEKNFERAVQGYRSQIRQLIDEGDAAAKALEATHCDGDAIRSLAVARGTTQELIAALEDARKLFAEIDSDPFYQV